MEQGMRKIRSLTSIDVINTAVSLGEHALAVRCRIHDREGGVSDENLWLPCHREEGLDVLTTIYSELFFSEKVGTERDCHHRSKTRQCQRENRKNEKIHRRKRGTVSSLHPQIVPQVVQEQSQNRSDVGMEIEY